MDFIKDPTTLFMLKMAITFGLMATAYFINRGLSWSLRKLHPYHPEKARSQLVFLKNLVRISVFFLLVSVWATQISGAFLSVIAIAGAMIITGKEVVLSLLGYVNISISKPFRIGDYIEVGQQNGRVIDIDLLSIKLFEIGMSGKYTGRRLAIPNMFVFTQTIKHSSMLGKFSLYTIEIILPFKADTGRAEAVALQVANAVSAAWVEEADKYFDRVEVSEFVDLPAAKPEVFWQAYNELAHKMIVRLACPLEKRGDAEQAIYKGFWREFGPV